MLLTPLGRGGCPQRHHGFLISGSFLISGALSFLELSLLRGLFLLRGFSSSRAFPFSELSLTAAARFFSSGFSQRRASSLPFRSAGARLSFASRCEGRAEKPHSTGSRSHRKKAKRMPAGTDKVPCPQQPVLSPCDVRALRSRAAAVRERTRQEMPAGCRPVIRRADIDCSCPLSVRGQPSQQVRGTIFRS